MNSTEIAGLIAEQNQQFMGQNAMASTIGVNPGMYGGMGQFGMAPGSAPVMPQAPGGHRIPGAFNYGSNVFASYGPGNRAGAAAGAALSAAPGIGLTAGEILALTKAPGLSPFLNPISGFAAGRAMGFGMMGAGAVAGAMMLPAMAVQHMAGQAVVGAQQQSMMNTALSPYQFLNPSSRTGFGFSRDDTHAIGSSIRQLAQIPELLTSVEELTKILPRIKQSGVMQGVHDASEFNRRFKETVHTVRDISRMLGTTLEEASEFFSHSRSVGFLGRNDQLRNAVNAQLTMSTTGMGRQEFEALQTQGANFATAVGANRVLGTKAATNVATQLGAAQMSGLIPEGLLEDLTGKQGGAAAADAAMRVVSSAMRGAGTGPGRFLLAGASQFKDGKATLDADIMRRLASGEMSIADVQARGSRLMSNHGNVLAFEASQGKLGMEFAGKGGAEAMFGLTMNATHDENAAKILYSRLTGANELDSDAVASLFKQQQLGMGSQHELVAQIQAQRASMADRSPSAVMKRLGTRVGNALSAPFREWGAEMYTKVSRGVDDFLDELVGNIFISASQEGRKQFMDAVTSGNMKSFLGGGVDLASKAGGASAFRGLLSGDKGAVDHFARAADAVGLTGINQNASGAIDQVTARLKKFDEGKLWGGSDFSVRDLSDKQKLGFSEMAQVWRHSMADLDFAKASPEEKMNRFMGEVSGRKTGRIASTYEDIVKEAQRRNPENPEAAIEAARTAVLSGAMQFVPEKELRMSATELYGSGLVLDIGTVGKEYTEAQRKLADVFGDHAPAMASSSKLREAFAKVSGNASLIARVNAGSADVAKELGLSPSEMSTLAGAIKAADRKGYNSKAAGDVLTSFSRSRQQNDIVASSSGVTDTATSISAGARGIKDKGLRGLAEGVGSAFANLGASMLDAKADTTGAMGEVDKSLNALYEHIQKNPDAIGALPPELQSAMGRMRAMNKKHWGKEISYEKLAEETGLSVSALREGIGVPTNTVMMTDERKKQVAAMAGRAGAFSGSSERSARVHQEAKDDAIVQTLKAIAEAVTSKMNDKDRDKVLGPARGAYDKYEHTKAKPG